VSNPIPPATVLIVEDQPTNMLLARTTLVRAGHRVLEATDASEARAQLALELPDIILMDIGLPGEDGLSLTRDLKSRSELVDIPIVAVTAHAMKNDLDQAQAAGCAGTLLKPYSPRQLVELVAEHRRKPAGKDA
jgi:CheY-like chemotaxis protein